MLKDIRWIDLSNGRPVRLLYTVGDTPQGSLITGGDLGAVHGSNAYNMSLAIAIKDKKVFVLDESGNGVLVVTNDDRPVATAEIGKAIRELLDEGRGRNA